MADSVMSDLNAEDQLSGLLDRVSEVMDTDIASIMLLDVHAQQLVSTAAKGLDEELRIGFRLNVGRGFAGLVAHRRAPVTIDEVQPDDVASEVLRRRGVKSLLGVPMFSGEDLVGVLQVGSLTPRTFTPDDVQLLQLAADRAGMASQVRLTRQDRLAALALQRSLLPTRLPAIDGLELAARYVPGHDTGVGGDWYDVFQLPSGWLGIVVGDVSGHGLTAAVVMGRLRSALRAYALECEDPADALMRLDRKIHHFETGSLVTALYAMVAPDQERMVVSVAGHPPPALVRPGEPAGLLSLPVDLPLGTGSNPARCNTVVELPAGSLLACYTDGLVERRGQPIDAGLDRLLSMLEAKDDAESACAAVMLHMGSTDVTDDIAILTMRRVPRD